MAPKKPSTVKGAETAASKATKKRNRGATESMEGPTVESAAKRAKTKEGPPKKDPDEGAQNGTTTTRLSKEDKKKLTNSKRAKSLYWSNRIYCEVA